MIIRPFSSIKKYVQIGLTAEKINIESNFSSEQKRTKNAMQDDIVMADRCSLRFHFWIAFCEKVGLNVDFLSRQTEFGHIF